MWVRSVIVEKERTGPQKLGIWSDPNKIKMKNFKIEEMIVRVYPNKIKEGPGISMFEGASR